MDAQNILVHADKTVLKIRGVAVKGLNTRELEKALTKRLGSVARVIGVTGEGIDMDVYGVPEEAVLRDADGVIRAVALLDGITAGELARIESAKRIVDIGLEEIPAVPPGGCAGERWAR